MRPEYQGRWWLPDNQSDVQGGVLTLEGDVGASLRLIGSFPSRILEARGSFSQYDLIYGRTTENLPITLIKCYETSSTGTLHDPSHRFQELGVFDVLIGAHIAEIPPKFETLEFEFTLLPRWAFNSQPTRIQTDVTDNSFSIMYSRRPPESVTLNTGHKLWLFRDFTYEERGGTGTLLDRCYFRIEFSSSTSLDEAFAEIVFPLQHLLSFATMKANGPRHTVVTHRDARIAGLEDRHVQILICRAETDKPPLARPPSTIPQDLLFALPHAPLRYDDLILRWFNLAPRLGAVLDLYLNYLYAPPRHLENQFMNMCQAAEGYHRVMLNHTLMPRDEHRILCRILDQACPDEHKDWLRSLLSHSNEPSFAMRIAELVAKASPAVEPLLATRPKYRQSMRDMRNNYAHWLETSAIPATVAEQLFDLTRTTRFILATCLLRDLGWSADQAAATLNINREFRTAVAEGYPGTHRVI